MNKNNKKVLERTRLQAASIFVDDAALGDEGMSLGVGVGVTAEGDELATGDDIGTEGFITGGGDEVADGIGVNGLTEGGERGAGDGGSGNSKISTILML